MKIFKKNIKKKFPERYSALFAVVAFTKGLHGECFYQGEYELFNAEN